MSSLLQSAAVNIPFWAGDTTGVAVTGKVTGDWTSTLSKAGGAQASMTVTITELGLGWYYAALTSTHTNTVGWMAMTFTATGVQQVNERFEVEAAKNDSLSARIPAALVSGRMDSYVGAFAAAVLDATAIASGAITAAKFAASAIDATAIATGAITAAKFAASAIDATAIASNAITAAKIASAAITSAKFAASAIDATAIASAALTSAKFATGALANGVFGAGAIDAAALASDTIAAAKIATGAITSAKFAAGAIDAAAIATDAIDADALKADAATEIAAAVAAPSAATIAAAVAAPSAATIAAAVAAPSAATIAAAVWALALDGSETAKGLLKRAHAVLVNKATGMVGSLGTFYAGDGSTKLVEGAQDVVAGARSAPTTKAGD